MHLEQTRMMDARELAGFSEQIARKAGAILLRGFRSAGTEISYKSTTNLVTSIDRESEAYLFNAITTRFPDHDVIAEEGSRADRRGEYRWYVDPLDGTNNYAHGLPVFCVSIGIYSVSAQKVIAGVVYDPLHDEFFSAVRGGGARLNGRPVRVSGTPSMAISILATGFPYDKNVSTDNNLREFTAIVPLIQGIRRMGSAAIDLCYVASGRLDGYWEKKLYPWDMAAGSLIVEEAGGMVTRYDGTPYDPEGSEILATNGMIHGQVSSILAVS